VNWFDPSGTGGGAACVDTLISLRLVVPFLRVTGTSPDRLAVLHQEGVVPSDFVDPNSRLRHRPVIELLSAAVANRAEPSLGLLAGERSEVGDFDMVGYASRCAATVRDAIHSIGRYMPLCHGGIRSLLREADDLATWELRIVDQVWQPPAANDFAISAALAFLRHHAVRPVRVHEVHLVHPVPTCAKAYARVFGTASIALDMPHNALVLARADLDTPLFTSHPTLATVFEEQAASQLERLQAAQSIEGRVRQVLRDQLPGGDIRIGSIARQMTMTEATLRRRLAEQRTSHSKLLDDLRRELADVYLRDEALPICEVSYRLGFSNVSSFYKAFHRWRGVTPARYRNTQQPAPASRP
jgi:AraC-like DNA-binding protein